MPHFVLDHKVSVFGGRIGTVYAPEARLEDVLGEPNRTPSCDGKVTVLWCFANTQEPEHPFEIRDYWWNMPGEWSIGGAMTPPALCGLEPEKVAARCAWNDLDDAQFILFRAWLGGLGLHVGE